MVRSPGTTGGPKIGTGNWQTEGALESDSMGWLRTFSGLGLAGVCPGGRPWAAPRRFQRSSLRMQNHDALVVVWAGSDQTGIRA